MIPSLIVLGKARHLDRETPGWADRVNIDRIDFAHPNNCILGQVYGDFLDAPWSLGGMMFAPFLLSFAFVADWFPGERKKKTWIACIKRRRTLYVPEEWYAEVTSRLEISIAP